jgi:hypothetical protein
VAYVAEVVEPVDCELAEVRATADWVEVDVEIDQIVETLEFDKF